MNYSQGVWDELFSSREWGKYPPLPLVRFIAKNFYKVSNRRDIRILELGSGPGPNLWYIAREGFIVYGVDGSPEGVKHCIQRLKDDRLEKHIGSIIAADFIDDFPFANVTFDAIVDVESLYCNPFNATRSLIRNCFKALKPGGKLFSMTFADGTWGFKGKETDYHAVIAREGPAKGTGIVRYTTREDIEKLYKLPNNQITSIERQDHILMSGKMIKEWIIETKKTGS